MEATGSSKSLISMYLTIRVCSYMLAEVSHIFLHIGYSYCMYLALCALYAVCFPLDASVSSAEAAHFAANRLLSLPIVNEQIFVSENISLLEQQSLLVVPAIYTRSLILVTTTTNPNSVPLCHWKRVTLSSLHQDLCEI